jgi:gluconate 2-dehydrogenase alpha chain
MRRLGSFLPGEGVGGSGVHWSGHTWRWTDMEFKVRSLYEERYGKSFIPADMTIQDWGITYDELEPYHDRFEYTAAISGKAGNLRGEIRPGGNPFEAPRAREYPLPPLTGILASEMFGEAARNHGYHPFRGRPPTPRAPTPIRMVRSSAPASIAAIASASAARQMPKAVHMWR